MAALDVAAEALFEADDKRVPIPPIRTRWAHLRVEDGYEIQAKVKDLHQEHGRKPGGAKIGATSSALQEKFQTTEPIYGYLFRDRILPSGSTVSVNDFIDPRLEVEVAFVLSPDPPKDNSRESLLDAVAYVTAAIEIADCRIERWDVGLSELVADNGVAAFGVIGTAKIDPRSVDLSDIEASLSFEDGAGVTGNTSAVLGDPVLALEWLAGKLAWSDLGSAAVVLSGACTAPSTIQQRGRCTATLGPLGAVEVVFT